MRTAAVVLIMLGAATPGLAHQGHHHQLSPSRIDRTIEGIQTPMPSWHDCNGGTCSLTGGPSGGPNQS